MLVTMKEASESGAVDWKDMSTMKELTCVHHTGMKYLTKNPWQRGLHIISVDPEILRTGAIECDCPFSDLRVVLPDSHDEVGS